MPDKKEKELTKKTTKRDKIFNRFLDIIEKSGNMLPTPATLFAVLALLVIVISEIVSLLNVSAIHPTTGELITPFSLFSIKGLHMIMNGAVENFTGFAPLGTVLVAMLGIGLAESTGLIQAALKKLVLSAPAHLLTFVIVFSGVMSNIASGIGYVVLLPLAAIIFRSVGRNPLVGLAAAYAGVAGGYSANLLVGTIDPLLAGLSQEAARIIDPSYSINAACNYYFMAASTFIIAFSGTWITDKLIEPRFGKYNPENGNLNNLPETTEDQSVSSLSQEEKRGLRFAFITTLLIVVIILAGVLPENGFFRQISTGSILNSPLLTGVVTLIFLVASMISIAYGLGAGTLKSEKDVVKGMVKSMSTMGTYIVLVFFAAQFVSFFNWTNLGLIVAVKGAETLKATGIVGIPLMLLFVFMASLINLTMGSASAKWAIMAPVFIPMFMMLGYTPEFVQVVYRIGDSVTNAISPMMSYFALVLAFVERYDKNTGIGSVIAMMLPYSVLFFVIWTIFLVIWMLLGIPVGPGASIYLPH